MKFVSFDQAAADLNLSRQQLAEMVLAKEAPRPARLFVFSETTVEGLRRKMQESAR